MELEVEEAYGKELDKEESQKSRELRKKALVKAEMQKWKEKNLGAQTTESQPTSPDLNDPNVKSKLHVSLSKITSDMEEFEKTSINTNLIPADIRSPEIVNALETTAVIIQGLPKDENGAFDIDDLDREINDLDRSPNSPWAQDPNKEYKVNIALISTGSDMKYKQAASAISQPENVKLSQHQVDWINNRIKELMNKRKVEKPIEKQPSPVQPSQPVVKPITAPNDLAKTQPKTGAESPAKLPARPSLQSFLQKKKAEEPETNKPNLKDYLQKRSSIEKPEDDF